MEPLIRRVIVLFVVLVAALGAAACGSSSKSSTAANPPTTPPSTPSTPTTASTPTTPAKIPASTPIGAPVVRAKFIAEIVKGGSPPQAAKANAGKIADCAIAKLKAEGVTTAAGLKDTARLSTILVDCAKPQGVTLK